MPPPVATRWLTPAALVLASALALGAARAETSLQPPERDQRGGRIGISTNTLWLPPAEGYAYLQRARDAGITWIREDFTWSLVEPTRGRFIWTRTDAVMRNASRLGISVLAIATYAPGWASGHSESNKYPPADPKDYARFVGAIADRYGRGGTFWRSNPRLSPSPLTAIELWNEPWHTEFWRSGPDPGAYARLVRATATAVKPRHPRITLLASGDLSENGGGAADWLAPLLAADPTLWRSRLVGAWSVHLYCQELSPRDTTSPQSERFDRLLLSRGLASQAGAEKPIWITEFGWSTQPGARDAVSEETQAEYAHDALLRAITEWASFVPRSFVFTWTKPSPGDQYNLVRPDGSPRPAWQAIKAFIATGT
jgi:hypothetical protein